MDAKNIILTPLYSNRRGRLYRSMHDARPTAPTGTLWYVSEIRGDRAALWSINGWGRIHEETAPLAMLFDDVEPKTIGDTDHA